MLIYFHITYQVNVKKEEICGICSRKNLYYGLGIYGVLNPGGWFFNVSQKHAVSCLCFEDVGSRFLRNHYASVGKLSVSKPRIPVCENG